MSTRPKPVASIALIAVVALSTACVSRGSYREVEQERDGLEEEVSNLETRNRALQTRLDNSNAAVVTLGGKLRASEEEKQRLSRTQQQLANELEREVDAGLIAVRMMQYGVQVQLSEEVLFPSGSTRLNDRGKAVLARVAAELKDIPYQVVVGGYSDNVPIGGQLAKTYPTNWDLAAARASRVVALLEEGGVPSGQLVAVSFGENNAVAGNDTPEGRKQNRRIELRIRPVAPGE